jgi:hypothetical protein
VLRRPQPQQSLPLLMLDEADRRRRLETKVSDMILCESRSRTLQNNEIAGFPSSRIQRKYATDASSTIQSEASLQWLESFPFLVTLTVVGMRS